MSIEGLLLDDPGCREVEALRARLPVAVISVGPGRHPDDAVAALKEETYRRGGRPLRLSRALDLPASWKRELGDAVAAALEIEEWEGEGLAALLLACAERLQIPSTVVIPVSRRVSTAVLPDVLAELQLAALITRDLGGPLNFLVILSGLCTPAGPAMPFIWKALHGSPRVVSPISGVDFTETGFETYFGLRVYWTAAGQPCWLEGMADGMAGPAEYEKSGAPDRRLDNDMERYLAGTTPPANEFVAALRWALPDPGDRAAFLRRGALTSGDPTASRLATAGLTWSPPGALKEVVTVAAALRLSEKGALSPADGVEDVDLVGLRAAARRNYLIGSWVLSLTAQIETELVELLRATGGWKPVFDRHDWTKGLEKDRVDHPPGIAAERPTDLLDFASFVQIQVAANQTGCTARLGLSDSAVKLVRQVRNLAAHQHVVTWTGVKAVAEAMDKVVNRGVRSS